MLKRKTMVIGFLAFCLTVTLFVGITASGNQNSISVKTEGTPTVYLDPQSVTSMVGQNFTVDIRIRDLEAASHLEGWEVKLGYCNMTLEALDCEAGPFMRGFEGPNGMSYLDFLHQDKGYVHVASWFWGLPDGDHDGTPGEEEDWPYGTGVLATVTFHCTRGGECVLDLYDTLLVDDDSNVIPHQVEDGYVTVPKVDLNNDGKVTISDIVIVALCARAFGAERMPNGTYWHDPPCPNCPH